MRNEALWKYIRDNTRVPGLVMGDLEAQIASAELGVQRFQRTHGEIRQGRRCSRPPAAHGLHREPCCGARSPRSRTANTSPRDSSTTTAAIAACTLPIKVTVRVRGDEVEVDLTGSSDQVPTAFNVPFEGSTKVACFFAFRALLLDTYTHVGVHPAERGIVPAGQGHGAARAASSIRSRRRRRRRASARSSASCDLIIKALAPVMPDKCTAGNARRRSPSRPIPGVRAERRLLGVPRGQRGGDGRPPAVGRPRHGRGADAQHAQQSARGSGHAPAADLRPLRDARRRAARRRQVPRRGRAW